MFNLQYKYLSEDFDDNEIAELEGQLWEPLDVVASQGYCLVREDQWETHCRDRITDLNDIQYVEGYVNWEWLAQDLTMDIIQGRGWPTDTRGALVSDLEMAGAAMVGGLQRGDLILAVDGRGIAGASELGAALTAALEAERPEIVFFVLRDPDTLFVVVKPGD